MSITFHLQEAQFRILAKDRLVTLQAIEQALIRWHPVYRSLADAFRDYGWVIDFRTDLRERTPDVDEILVRGGLDFEGLERFFAAIHPYVVPGSYIHVFNEVGQHWKWVFDHTSCRRIEGRVVFDT